jgi:hypothetical protein
MKKLFLSLMVGLLGLTLAGLSWAQPAAQPGQPGAPKAAARMYDLATVETLGGEVVQVNVAPSRRTGAPGRLNLLLKTDKETVTVHLGPSRYLDQQNFKLAAGDRVEVTGSRITRPGRTFIVAGEVKKGEQVLKLRDDQGNPLWPRGRRR